MEDKQIEILLDELRVRFMQIIGGFITVGGIIGLLIYFAWRLI